MKEKKREKGGGRGKGRGRGRGGGGEREGEEEGEREEEKEGEREKADSHMLLFKLISSQVIILKGQSCLAHLYWDFSSLWCSL